MFRSFSFAIVLVFLIFNVTAHQRKYSQFCRDNKRQSLSCSTQLAGEQPVESDICQVQHYASDSPECRKMDFGPIKTNSQIGGVSLKPYLIDDSVFSSNFTVLNITFTNIKWKKMKFRFKPTNHFKNHCRDIVLSNNFTVDDRSVLYYDCYWSVTDGDYMNTSHILDFVAQDDVTENRGQYYFNIPTMQMLNPHLLESQWKPFLYIEILSSILRLHIMPPLEHLKITGYNIEVWKGCPKVTPAAKCSNELIRKANVSLSSFTEEMVSDYYYLSQYGSFYFVVTPLHKHCSGSEKHCQRISSPVITISNEPRETVSICIASATALVAATLLVYYLIVRAIRKYCCKDYSLASAHDVPAPTKVLIINSSANKLHAECVMSFVMYLRSEYGFEVTWEGDITNTKLGDPFIWAEEAVRMSTHVLYVVGPANETNINHSIYEKPLGAHKDVDILLLNMLKSSFVTRPAKNISNIYFEHSTGVAPIETRHGRKFYLLKDWQKLISHLSENMLPKKQIIRTERGRYFIDDLTKAKKLLGTHKEQDKILV